MDDSYWERTYRHYDHTVVSFFSRQRIRYLVSWFDLKDIQSALDVGCGNGVSTYYMGQHISKIWGIDRSSYMLSRHPLIKSGKIVLADGLRLPFPENRFDLVFAWEALHHVSDPKLMISEMARVSRHYILAVEPNRNHPAQFAFALTDKHHRAVLHYSRKYLCTLFQSAGLKVDFVGCGGWLFPNMTPQWLLPLIRILPYRFPLGISNWVLGSKSS